jgi:hypothetical protein
MGECRRIRVFSSLIPFNRWRTSWIKSHLSKCESCQEDLATSDEGKAVTIGRDDIALQKDLWPQFAKDLEERKQPKEDLRRPAWQWIIGTAAAMVVVFGIVMVMTHSPPERDQYSAANLVINYVKIYEEPAQAFIFQTQDTNRTFIWVEKQTKGDMP